MKTLLLLLLLPFQLSAQFLFPGDTNNDGRADYLDLLPIGVAYGAEGPPRPSTGVDWAPKFFLPWAQFLPQSNVNFGFADTDGNGFIDSLDVEIIAFNYDSLQMGSQPPPLPYFLPDTLEVPELPFISILFPTDTADILDTVVAEIRFNVSPNIFPGAMAVALQLDFDPENIQQELTRIRFDSLALDLMGVGAASHFTGFERALPPGRVELAVSGRAQNALAITRKIADMVIVIDVIIREEEDVTAPFWFEFSHALLINANEQVLKVNTFSDTIILRQKTSALANPDLNKQVRVFPNPAGERINVESAGGFPLEKVTLWNGLGVAVFEKTETSCRLEIPLEHLPAGLYLAEIRTENGQVWKKLIVAR